LVPARVLRGERLSGTQSVTLHLTAPDGRVIAVETSETPLHDAAGSVSGAVVVYRDVTERRAAEQVLRQQAALLSLARDAIIVRGPGGIIRQWNDGAEALYGWSAEEAAGQLTHELLRTRILSTDGTAGGVDDLDAALGAAGTWEGRLQHTRRDGLRVVVESRQALLRDESGRPAATLEINRDVTARDAFLAGIAHDLKTPLTSIRGQAQLAVRRLARLAEAEVVPIRTQLAQIDAGTQRLERLIDELGDIARLQMGTVLEVERRPVELVELVRAIVAQQEGLTGHRLAVESTVSELAVTLDGPRVERVLGNLLANAIKYSPPNGSITVQVTPTDDAWGPGVAIAVQDQGIGIPSADLPHIFEHFHRARNVVGVVPGSGIGLASARAIITQHGGTIEVASAEGRGTTVRVWLPRTPPVDGQSAGAAPGAQPDCTDGGPTDGGWEREE
jgi:PAS domain S-box-containing protein